MDWEDRCKRIARYILAIVKVAWKEFGTPLFTTSVHKLVYFLLVYRREHDLLRESYMAYQYGPYSYDVGYCLQILSKKSYLIAQSNCCGTLYRPNPVKIKSSEDTKKERDAFVLLSCLKDRFGEVNNTAALIRLSGTHFLMAFYKTSHTDKIARKSRLFGWKLSEEEINKHIQTLKEIGLLF